MLQYLTMTKRRVLTVVALVLIAIALWLIAVSPSHERLWVDEHEYIATANVTDTYTVNIENVRNFKHTAGTSSAHWEDRALDLRTLDSLDYIVVPFSGFGAAHTMLSFGFSDGSHIGVSIEARRENDEEFSPLWGALRKYELLYVIADEHDLLTQRAIGRGNDEIYLYPVNASRDQIRHLLLDILARANAINNEPEFYNTLTNSCTTNIMEHVNAIAPGKVPYWDLRLYFPRYSDTLAQKLGFIPNSIPINELRNRYEISESIKENSGSPHFSELIRNELGS
ncbi:MAG: DUF4105 domain-containing protein [Candidatus Paceibacterota bacterium]